MYNRYDIILFIMTILIIDAIDICINEGYLILGITYFVNLYIIAVRFILNVKEHKRSV